MGIAIDGTPGHNGSQSGTTATVTLTTTQSGSVFVSVLYNSSSATITSVTDNSGVTGTWSQITTPGGSATQSIACWGASSSGAMTGATITAHFSTSASFATLDAWGVSGATAFSGNIYATAHGNGDPLSSGASINANDMVCACFRSNGSSTPTEGTGFTRIASHADFTICEYQIPGSSGVVSCTVSAGDSGTMNGAVVFGITATSVIPPINLPSVTGMFVLP